MNNDIAIQFDHVGKLYKLGLVGTGTLSHDLNRWWKTTILRQEDPYLKIGEANDRTSKGSSDYVWALKDIAFNVNQGDVVGIIGKNGAGKSTLLKLLSRVTSPTTGVIRAKGRIASLLEVGTGFHPELTGRENIYMNGSIMGMTKSEITRKLDEIVDFAGVERYLDTPTKRYSSGMTVRLGFAVAAFLEPEILVVDEVLAVGDAEFQKKAIGKMQDVSKGQGRTVLFVSHNMAAIRNLCNRSIVLHNGSVCFDGQTEDAIEHYLNNNNQSLYGKIINKITKCNPAITIDKIEFNGSDECITTITSRQESVKISIYGNTKEMLHADLMVRFKTIEDVPVATFAEGHYKGRIEHIKPGYFVIQREIKLPKILSNGDFVIDIILHHPNVEGYMDCIHGVQVHLDGYQSEYGKPLDSKKSGFLGLESVE
ncbi:MAG TPA: ABC transporter ATP-binding protein [Phocaeicola coprocola]|uniref:ABC transporter ATP-binding protein n=1 Tax=Phocaeicola coprocola TaxID=310298 RepID=A0A921FEU8_9BACT|nr:ABC transporter ATP-binding protein [Phocaeicola coprocola]